MKRALGVARRSGSANWQWSIRPPADLRAHYSTQWAYRCSLKTPDLRQANARAARLLAWWHERFAAQRSASGRQLNPCIKPKCEWLFESHYQPTPPSSHATDSAPVVIPASPSPPRDPRASTPLRQVFTLWKAAKRRSTDSARACERSLILFEQLAGTLDVQQVTRGQGDAFRAHLLELPLASKTKHDHMTWLKSLLKYASRDLELLPRNPWEGLDIAYKTETPREPWSIEQLGALLSQPLFRSYALPKAWRSGGAAAYWIPLLGMFTGARIGELCQLRVTDIRQDALGATIHISEEAEGASVKTVAGIRQVPVHSELIRLGFLDYVDQVRRAESDSLWPGMKFRAGKPGAYFSAWFSDLRKTCSIPVPDFPPVASQSAPHMATQTAPRGRGELIR